jgi:alcohol dehydrogenase class IV
MPDLQLILPDTLVLPEKTISGRGKVQGLLAECARFGRRGILLHGASLASGHVLDALLGQAPHGMAVLPFRHRGGEPTLSEVKVLIEAARGHQAEWIAGVGGGSVLDLGKAAAALHHATGPLETYHNGAAIASPGITFLAAPTTAGTGSEATVNSVLTNELTGAKKSIRDIGMMARVVILDPDLIRSCPRPIIAASGMDALTQAIEAFTSRKATWLSDQLARQGLTLIAANLEAVQADPAATPRAEALLTGSYLTGVALSFARLGVVHGLAHPLGTLYHVPHGQVCAACLPHALELNREAFGGKYAVMSQAVGGDLIAKVQSLSRTLGLVSPFAGQTLWEKETIVTETLASGSTQANPKSITRADVEWFLDRLFGHS